MHFMKKIFLLLAAACVTLSAAADEGMWMLPYLQKMNSKDMKAADANSRPRRFTA